MTTRGRSSWRRLTWQRIGSPRSLSHCAPRRAQRSVGWLLARRPATPGQRRPWPTTSRIPSYRAHCIKYSPAATQIAVSARIADGAELEFTVEHEGPGMRARQSDSNYQPREQANDSANDSGGGRRGADAQAPLEQPQGQRL